ncbi:hypothetical protein CEUSTIGMA_g261.t1 [Chlamydomonas eustigma]|uniref:Uncharacterized protein n=1 Tax=Chlamydomonas eustigma TaxID=1157962 RepID=A0A250WQ31_9CHLO|nr:hypothetical protein CEUSTIGMA_g261.t1 [Chlamydomonas eustigma]|eukprot:GAX72806.1 hypothetical protein CEUSTIGMA_g261.t1 [Chlamydomonas eustigma]
MYHFQKCRPFPDYPNNLMALFVNLTTNTEGITCLRQLLAEWSRDYEASLKGSYPSQEFEVCLPPDFMSSREIHVLDSLVQYFQGENEKWQNRPHATGAVAIVAMDMDDDSGVPVTSIAAVVAGQTRSLGPTPTPFMVHLLFYPHTKEDILPDGRVKPQKPRPPVLSNSKWHEDIRTCPGYVDWAKNERPDKLPHDPLTRNSRI